MISKALFSLLLILLAIYFAIVGGLLAWAIAIVAFVLGVVSLVESKT